MALPIKFIPPLNRKESKKFYAKEYEILKEHHKKSIEERKNEERVMRDIINSVLKGRNLTINV